MRGIHPAQLRSLIKRKGKTLKQLARENDVSETVITKAIHGSSPYGEQIISEYLNIPLCEIWPELWSTNNKRISA